MKTKYLLLASYALLLGACTWVELEDGGARVRVAGPGALASSCVAKGEITVGVKDGVGFYNRDERKVRDELETLARNQAADLGANTIQAMNEPIEGEQKFSAWMCAP